MRNQLLFEEIFQESPVPSVILGADAPAFTIIEVNQSFLRLSNRSRQDLIGQGFFQTYPHPDVQTTENAADVRKSLAQVLQDKRSVRDAVQQINHRSTGTFQSLFFLQATNKPVLDESGKIKYIIRSLEDVTETVVTQIKEREINQALSENERFLKDTQSAGRIGSWQLNRDYTVTWSDIHYQIFETEEDFQPTVKNCLTFLRDDKSRGALRSLILEALATGGAFDEEFEIITAKGNSKWIRFAGRGEVGEGELLRLYGIAQDITSHKMLELQLTHSRNQYLELIQTIQGVVWEADFQTLEMTFISEQVTNILGYTEEECANQPRFWQSRLHPNNREETIRYTLEQLQKQKNFSHDYRVMKKDGSYVWLRTSFSVVRENDTATRIRGLMVDVTDTKLLTDLDRLEKNVLTLNSTAEVSLEEVLSIYLEGITELFPEMRCALMKIKNGYMYNWVSTSLPTIYEEAIEGLPIGKGAGSCGTAAFRKEMVVVSDIATDPLWAGYRDLALRENLRSCWSYPIINSRGEVMATLGMYYSTIKEPSEGELKVVERTASILKVIIEQNHYAELVEEANSLMRQSQELAHFGVLHWDIAANRLSWSKEMYAIFDIDPHVEITQEGHFDLLHPDDREEARVLIGKLFESRQDQIFEERIIRPDGEIRHLKTWVRLKTDRNGEPIQMIGACIDMTENKRYEERLLASERRLRNILDSQTNYVVRIGLDYKYRYTNRKFVEDFAFEEEADMIGLDAFRTVREKQKEEVKDVIRRCIAHPGETGSIELEKLSPSFPNKATFWNFVCLTDSDGIPSEIQGIGIDVSERKKAEKDRELKEMELKASEKRYSDLFHLSPQPMYLFDTDTLKFLDVNNAAISQYGYSREEFLAMTIEDIKSPEEKVKLVEEMALAERNNIDFYRSTFIHLTKKGEAIQVELHSNLIPFKDHSARLVLASNITNRMEYLKALELQNTKLREIAWTQSHVVRAPLARIMALIDMIKNYPELNEENHQMLAYIFTSAVELDEVIREISRKAEAVSFEDPN